MLPGVEDQAVPVPLSNRDSIARGRPGGRGQDSCPARAGPFRRGAMRCGAEYEPHRTGGGRVNLS
jgi:hypothetical protein